MGFILGPNGANLPFEILVSCLIVIFPRRPCIWSHRWLQADPTRACIGGQLLPFGDTWVCVHAQNCPKVSDLV
jgi:hypothetical protein